MDDRPIKKRPWPAASHQGLSTADIHVIARITQSDQVRIKSLPELTKLSQPTISRTITKLEQRNLLEKYRTVKNDKGILVR
ncbi:MarR family transcriptional regulator [Secundilactobacillus paracollinoides]|uniref:MarR family transcriptional regulator n=1 Tax=Secundilactobacillus paracollinoides TaxID=240427 RepID=UPI0006D0817E|nr:helix-turn-helix domain-containing protein [Secundilactobacillus paracollinoides]